MPWQTSLDTYSRFPRCCKSFWEMNDHTPNATEDDDGEPQTAFYCKHYSGYRILEMECLGEECPDCELVGIDEYKRLIGGIQ